MEEKCSKINKFLIRERFRRGTLELR